MTLGELTLVDPGRAREEPTSTGTAAGLLDGEDAGFQLAGVGLSEDVVLNGAMSCLVAPETAATAAAAAAAAAASCDFTAFSISCSTYKNLPLHLNYKIRAPGFLFFKSNLKLILTQYICSDMHQTSQNRKYV